MNIILTTAGKKNAKKIAQALVKENLAACVNKMPVESTYLWKNRIWNEKEMLLIIKTARPFSKVEKRIKELHSYEVPEILLLDVKKGNKAYLDWIKNPQKKIL